MYLHVYCCLCKRLENFTMALTSCIGHHIIILLLETPPEASCTRAGRLAWVACDVVDGAWVRISSVCVCVRACACVRACVRACVCVRGPHDAAFIKMRGAAQAGGTVSPMSLQRRISSAGKPRRHRGRPQRLLCQAPLGPSKTTNPAPCPRAARTLQNQGGRCGRRPPP